MATFTEEQFAALIASLRVQAPSGGPANGGGSSSSELAARKVQRFSDTTSHLQRLRVLAGNGKDPIDSENWFCKSRVIKDNLGILDLWDVVFSAGEQASPSAEGQTDSTTVDPMAAQQETYARFFIEQYLTLSDSQLFAGAKTAKDLWEHLSSTYDNKNIANRANLIAELASTNPGSFAGVAEYFAQMTQLVSKLVLAGGTMDDSTVIGFIGAAYVKEDPTGAYSTMIQIFSSRFP
jgi:hypothetical protein